MLPDPSLIALDPLLIEYIHANKHRDYHASKGNRSRVLELEGQLKSLKRLMILALAKKV